MSPEAITQIAIQVPALAILGLVFYKVLGKILDEQGKKLERLADAVAELARRCPAR